MTAETLSQPAHRAPGPPSRVVRTDHSPGPWETRDAATRTPVVDRDGRPVAYVHIGPAQDFNAALIAAAPLLLAALRDMNAGCGDIVGGQADHLIVRLPISAIQAAAAAIEQATLA